MLRGKANLPRCGKGVLILQAEHAPTEEIWDFFLLAGNYIGSEKGPLLKEKDLTTASGGERGGGGTGLTSVRAPYPALGKGFRWKTPCKEKDGSLWEEKVHTLLTGILGWESGIYS